MIGQLANSIRQHLGIPVTRSLNVVRRLREAGMFPSGGPGRGPEFARADIVTLLVAVSTGAKLDDVAASTRATLATVPGGANLAGAPLTVPRTAEIALAVLATQAAEGDDLDELTIEIAHGEPEVALVWPDGVTQRLQAPGAIANHVPRGRVATRIPGSAFAAILRKFK
ncbi:hypothetical protein [Agrobacterium tumefaciens]|uniref:hypothetical protein n=1 Tax=Agrobacterium tumefaciens TaxID=358 RepID=UPI0021D2AE89|nr:hypothetical protein [Agrobacterium tumefaciens]UXS08697.1 hypothetical protein FY155_03405 [Agrobacterium tumefaciens]UXS16057.1 hypothetical protein FY154_03400 [Agrobacterium tumefaciens]